MPHDHPKRSARSSRRAFRGQVEVLECRALLSLGESARLAGLAHHAAASASVGQTTVAANELYLSYLEDQLAGGPIAAAENRALLGELNRGRPRAAVVEQLLKTPEVKTQQTNLIYLKWLGRLPTPAEKARATATLGDGRGLLRVEVALAGSQAYYQGHGGGTAAGFVTSLYQTALDRTPSASESSRWLEQLRRGVGRADVARAILTSGEATRVLASGMLLRMPGWGGAQGLARAVSILRGPGGYAALATRVYGSPAYFVQETAPSPAGSEPLVDVTDHPPGLPMTPTLDLGTLWYPLTPQTDGPTVNGSSLISAASDGTVLVTNPGSTLVYEFEPESNPSTPEWHTASSNPVLQFLAISAVSQNDWWGAVINTSISANSYFIAPFNSGGATGAIYFPPSGQTPKAISAAADGTVWLQTQTGQIYSLDTAEQENPGAWTPVATDGYTITGVSVGSAANIWATGQQGTGGNPVILHWVNNAWQVDPVVAGATPTHVSAASDGSVWAWNSSTVYLRPATTGIWNEVSSQLQTPPAGMGAGAALSQFRLAVVLSDNTVRILSVGVADQQSPPLVPTDPGQAAAYWAISKALAAASPMGIRGDYPSTLQETRFSDDHTILMAMANPAPKTIPAADWNLVKGQILSELEYVPQIYTLFNEIDYLNSGVLPEVQNNVNTVLTGIKDLVGTTDDTQVDQNTTSVIWEGMIEAALAGIASAGSVFGDTFAVVASILSSGFSTAVSAVSGVSNPQENQAFQIKYSQFTTDLEAIFTNAENAYAGYFTAILDDWSKVEALGQAINNNAEPWMWDPTQLQDIAGATTDAFKYFITQSLMAAQWQEVEVLDYDADYYGTTLFPIPSPPSYDLITQTVGYYSDYNLPIFDLYYLDQIGSDNDLYASDGIYPSQSLIQTLDTTYGADLNTLLTPPYPPSEFWNFNVVEAT